MKKKPGLIGLIMWLYCATCTAQSMADDNTEEAAREQPATPDSEDASDAPAPEPDRTKTPKAPVPSPDTSDSAKTDERILRETLRRLDSEPSLDTLIQAALKTGNADVAGARTWARRVRLSPMLPTLKVSMGYDLERDESLDRPQQDPDRWGADTDRDLAMQVTAQWELDKLIFHPDELRVYNSLADRAERRDTISAMVIGYWFERRQLQITLAVRPPENIAERVSQSLRVKELGALIDALTGGILARNLYKSDIIDPTPEAKKRHNDN